MKLTAPEITLRACALIGALVLISLLAGCASMDLKGLENRVVCTVAKDEAHVVSKWGAIGIASKIADADRAAVCK